MSGIGVNRGTIVNQEIVIGKELGKFNSKKEAQEAAAVNHGSEIIYQKDNQWQVSEVKEKLLMHQSSVSKDDKQDIELVGNKLGNVKDVTISFVEDDISKSEKPRLADTTKSKYVLDKLADEKPLNRSLLNMGLWDNKVLKTKTNVASNPQTSPATLEKLANEEYVAVKTEVAKNPNTNAKTLEKLAKDESSAIVQEVAANKNTSPNTLKELFKKNDFSINTALANNPSTPKELLKELANDKSGFSQVKEGVAGNPNTPKETLELLAKDQSDSSNKIKEKLLGNPVLPHAFKAKLK